MLHVNKTEAERQQSGHLHPQQTHVVGRDLNHAGLNTLITNSDKKKKVLL